MHLLTMKHFWLYCMKLESKVGAIHVRNMNWALYALAVPIYGQQLKVIAALNIVSTMRTAKKEYLIQHPAAVATRNRMRELCIL